jgi:Rrf2 family protein
MSDHVEWALHCAVALSSVPEGSAMPASKLAELHGVPGAYLAKALQALSRAGVVEAVPGRSGGYRLARVPARISFLAVVEAVEGDEPAFTCNEIRANNPAVTAPDGGYPSICTIAATMARAERAWRSELAAVSIADVARTLDRKLTAADRRATDVWIRAASHP